MPQPKNRGKLGTLVIIVEPVITRSGEEYIRVSTPGNMNTIPAEIADAARMWYQNYQYAGLDLTEYLNKMFDPNDYTPEAL